MVYVAGEWWSFDQTGKSPLRDFSDLFRMIGWFSSFVLVSSWIALARMVDALAKSASVERMSCSAEFLSGCGTKLQFMVLSNFVTPSLWCSGFE